MASLPKPSFFGLFLVEPVLESQSPPDSFSPSCAVDARSTPGVGSTFSFTLPFCAPAASPERARLASQGMRPRPLDLKLFDSSINPLEELLSLAPQTQFISGFSASYFGGTIPSGIQITDLKRAVPFLPVLPRISILVKTKFGLTLSLLNFSPHNSQSIQFPSFHDLESLSCQLFVFEKILVPDVQARQLDLERKGLAARPQASRPDGSLLSLTKSTLRQMS